MLNDCFSQFKNYLELSPTIEILRRLHWERHFWEKQNDRTALDVFSVYSKKTKSAYAGNNISAIVIFTSIYMK